MSRVERVRFVRSNLGRAGYFDGPASDELDPQLRDAIARYQAEHDLVASGRIDFDLYYRLIASAGRQKAVASSTPRPTPIAVSPQATSESSAAAQVATAPPLPPSLQLSTIRGGRPTYHMNETLEVVAVTAQDAFLYCYYQDADGTVARIFPNRFQPNALVRGGTPTEIPPAAGKAFAIRFDKSPAKEAVACVASTLELGLKLPDQLKAQDLAPLPVRGLQDIVRKFRQLGGNQMTEGWLPIEVM
jgi:peptidoglycan hydrolase-like protein with peptidoglycan-binding domain